MHNFEWRKHSGEFLILSVLFTISILAELTLCFMLYWFFMWNFNKPGGHDHNSPMNNKKAEFWLFFSLLNFVELLPVFAFLVKNTLYPPHDCFPCFNKDPVRKYSIYQYTRDEWKQLLYMKRPENARLKDARELAEFLDEHEHENVPSVANTSQLCGQGTKHELLVTALSMDHKVMDKF
jgi:hypothetical protein